jgi:hypothetical protein
VARFGSSLGAVHVNNVATSGRRVSHILGGCGDLSETGREAVRDYLVMSGLAQVVAVDFGAAWTKAAWSGRGGGAHLVRFGSESGFASVVHVADGRGVVEVHEANGSPWEVRDLKHRVGRPGDDDPVDRAVNVGSGTSVRLVDLVAAVLAHALEGVPGGAASPKSAVLTHPVLWGDPERHLLATALRAAGGPDGPEFMSEPEAVARFAVAEGLASFDDGAVAVFDVGANTLDVAILELQEDHVMTLASDGHPSGGDDLDLSVLHYVESQIDDDEAVAFSRAWHHQPYSATAEARRAKEALSTMTQVVFAAPLLDDDGQGGSADVGINRDDFTGEIEHHLGTWSQVFEDCLDTLPAGTTLGTIVGSGGSVRVPAVQELLKDVAAKHGAKFVVADTGGFGAGQAVAPGALYALAERWEREEAEAARFELQSQLERERERFTDEDRELASFEHTANFSGSRSACRAIFKRNEIILDLEEYESLPVHVRLRRSEVDLKFHHWVPEDRRFWRVSTWWDTEEWYAQLKEKAYPRLDGYYIRDVSENEMDTLRRWYDGSLE